MGAGVTGAVFTGTETTGGWPVVTGGVTTGAGVGVTGTAVWTGAGAAGAVSSFFSIPALVASSIKGCTPAVPSAIL
ncbi:hypothetical protein D3C72_1370960 [compost metagenome]